jgi:UDP-N-acetyl-D-mannosaminuronic acid dehydrogenase
MPLPASPEADLVIVGGAGHVGLPLALVFCDRGLRVRIVDPNRAAWNRISEGHMPFVERGADPLLDAALSSGRLSFSTDPQAIAGIPTIVLTIGTPVDEFLNPEMSVIRRWVDDVAAVLDDAQLVVLRSTVYPGTTEWLARHLAERGHRPRIAYCPERIAQGFAVEELQQLPQLVSGTTPEAEEAAAALFEGIAPETVRMKPMEAEFAKLFTNAYRYIVFAVVNQFYMLAARHDVDFARILHGCRHEYPRMAGMPKPGLAAGPCLFKDTMQLAAFSNNQFVLGHSAMLVNEGLPAFLVSLARERTQLIGRTAGILGMAFKAEIDDARSSLSYKLKKLLSLEARQVLCTDPFVPDDDLVPLERVVAESDVLFVATPHRAYRDVQVPPGKVVIDVWNCLPGPGVGGSPAVGSATETRSRT